MIYCDKCKKELNHENQIFNFNSKIKLTNEITTRIKDFNLCQNCTLELYKYIGFDINEIIQTGCFDLNKIN